MGASRGAHRTGRLHSRKPGGRRTGRSRRPWHSSCGLRPTSSLLPTGGISDADAGSLAIPSTGVVAVADGRGIRPGSLAADMAYEGPAFLDAHCRSNLGLILCDVGRWDEAEGHAARLASSRTARAGPRTDGQVRAALAELWSCRAASTTPNGCSPGAATTDAVLPLAALHLAQHAWPDAASLARHGI